MCYLTPSYHNWPRQHKGGGTLFGATMELSRLSPVVSNPHSHLVWVRLWLFVSQLTMPNSIRDSQSVPVLIAPCMVFASRDRCYEYDVSKELIPLFDVWSRKGTWCLTKQQTIGWSVPTPVYLIKVKAPQTQKSDEMTWCNDWSKYSATQAFTISVMNVWEDCQFSTTDT